MPGCGGWQQVYKLPVFLRKKFIEQFVDQKEKEHQQMENERKKAKLKK